MARMPFVRIVKGKYAYFRSKETGDTRLPSLPGDPAFQRAYAEQLELRERLRANAGGPAQGSFAWLIKRYLASAEFAALADATQLDYGKTCDLLTAELGDQPYRLTTRAMLKAVRDDHAATPRKAHKIKQMLSRLYSWADEEGLVPAGFNPAGGLKRLARKGGAKEITVWSDEEIGWVLAAAAPHLQTPVILALYTGQRREDVVTMRWNQWQGDIIRVRTSKTRKMLDIPCHPVLKAHLQQLRDRQKVVAFTGTIALTEAGEAFTANGLSGQVRRVVEKLPQIPGPRSLHGLRYAAGSRMEEGGATPAMIAEVLGHATFAMALKYAGQRVRARGAIEAMESTTSERQKS